MRDVECTNSSVGMHKIKMIFKKLQFLRKKKHHHLEINHELKFFSM